MKIKSIIPIEQKENCRCDFCGETRSVKYRAEVTVCNRCAALHVQATEMERSYVDLLQELKSDVKFDIIPFEDKAKTLCLIERLENILWKYSY